MKVMPFTFLITTTNEWRFIVEWATYLRLGYSSLICLFTGTHDIHALILGRAITNIAAFK